MDMCRRLSSLLALTVLACGLTACSPASAPVSSPVPTQAVVPTEPSGGGPGSFPKAGYTVQGDVVIVRGWLVELDIEGGTWIVDGAPPTSSAQHPTLAVLVDGKVSTSELAKYRERSTSMGFVEIRGRKGADVSIRMAGPEVLVDEVTLF